MELEFFFGLIEELRLHLEFKLIVDIVLVGYLFVGKLMMIAVLSNVKLKIAVYLFTILVFNLGVVKWKDYGEFVIVDVFGLIEGVHEGYGLGI